MNFDKDRLSNIMFDNNNRISFDCAVDDDAKRWWAEKFFRPHNLTPEKVGDLLSATWDQEKLMRVTEFDGQNQRFAIRVEGSFGEGDFWFHARTLDLVGNFINADRMFIPANRRQNGFGRKFMADAIGLARSLDIAKVRLDAEHIGRYVWLRIGFVPDRGSWSRLRIELTHRLATAIPDLGIDRFQEILGIIQSPNPEAAREVAQLRDPVKSTELLDDGSRDAMVPIGRALFLEVGSNWSGEFDVNDERSRVLMEAYTGEA